MKEKIITEKDKKRLKYQKELKSFRNRMGSNIVWFDSLSVKKQYDLLFEWKREKYHNKLTEPKINYVKLNRWGSLPGTGWMVYSSSKDTYVKNGRVKRISYPASLKHFIKSKKSMFRYKVSVSSTRNAVIDILLKNKIK